MALAPLALARERAAWAEERLLVGVDEAGRGPLAGPVVAAAVVFPPGCRAVRGLRDSKMLPARGRAASSPSASGSARSASASAPPRRREIDRLNIRVATALAMRRALDRAAPPAAAAAGAPYRILIDGLPLPELGYAHEALVDGDARCQSIAAAAIVAKTVRDRLMQRLAPPLSRLRLGDQHRLRHRRSITEGSACTAPPAITA